MTSDYRESFSKNTFLPSLPPRGMETDGRRINRGGGAENSPLPRVSIRRKTASNLRELVYCWRAKWESGRKTTLVPPNEKWFGGWKGNGGFFFPPFFLSFPPLVTRLFFQGNIKCEFFFLGVFCRIFFRVSLLLLLLLLLSLLAKYTFGDDSEHSAVRKCLPVFDRMPRLYDCAYIRYCSFFFYFFFRFTGLIATIRSNRGNETKRFVFCISY